MNKRLANKILKVNKELNTCEAMESGLCYKHRKEDEFLRGIVSKTGKWWIKLIEEAKEVVK